MVKPGGTGMPRLVISASSEPLPPSNGRSALDPSALPAANEYTYFGTRASAFFREVARADFRVAECFITTPARARRLAETSAGPARANAMFVIVSVAGARVNE